jgi:N-acetylglucosamine-6-sulfatase
MRPTYRRRRRRAVAVSVLVLAAAVLVHVPAKSQAALPPNIILILTDDQTMDTLPSNPAAMPWLQSQIFGTQDPHWKWFTNAFFNTPLCCPSRATILTGQYSHHTRVQGNDQGQLLDESNTLATWLHDGGYTTALIGKYLNKYPWNRGPYIPAGWDRWVGKRNTARGTTYNDYQVIDQGVPLFVGGTTAGYATNYLGNQALDFLKGAPADRPYFLMFTPSAPHSPWIPAPRYEGAFDGLHIKGPSPRVLNDVRGKPAWVQALTPITPERAAHFIRDRRKERETLLALDDWIHAMVAEVAARGELDNTVIIFLTDNGYAFGQHRWSGKRCPYDECIRTPLAIRTPWASSGVIPDTVSNVDLAPTIAELAGVTPQLPQDGFSLAGDLLPPAAARAPPPANAPVLIEWAGDSDVPPWEGVRTRDFAYIEDDDGTVELYDLTGVIGNPDPSELRNVANVPAYATVRSRLASTLVDLASSVGTGG